MHPGVHRQLCAGASPCSSLSVVSSVFPVPQDSPVQSSVQNPGTLLQYLMHTSCSCDGEKSCRKTGRGEEKGVRGVRFLILYNIKSFYFSVTQFSHLANGKKLLAI